MPAPIVTTPTLAQLDVNSIMQAGAMGADQGRSMGQAIGQAIQSMTPEGKAMQELKMQQMKLALNKGEIENAGLGTKEEATQDGILRRAVQNSEHKLKLLENSDASSPEALAAIQEDREAKRAMAKYHMAKAGIDTENLGAENWAHLKEMQDQQTLRKQQIAQNAAQQAAEIDPEKKKALSEQGAELQRLTNETSLAIERMVNAQLGGSAAATPGPAGATPLTGVNPTTAGGRMVEKTILKRLGLPDVQGDAEKVMNEKLSAAGVDPTSLTMDQKAAKLQEVTKKARSPTESQTESARFSSRMAFNANVIDKTIYSPTDFWNGQWAPNLIKGEEQQKYNAAKMNWIAANLRKESGALISKEDYVGANIQYFPQIGDRQAVIKQKASLRKLAQMDMQTAAGELSEKMGAKSIPDNGQPAPGSFHRQNGILYQWDGKQMVPLGKKPATAPAPANIAPLGSLTIPSNLQVA